MYHCNPQPEVTPALKIEDDLRPISLTAVLFKQLESIVGGWMLGLIVDRLDIRQFGGMKGLSTILLWLTWFITGSSLQKKRWPLTLYYPPEGF